MSLPDTTALDGSLSSLPCVQCGLDRRAHGICDEETPATFDSTAVVSPFPSRDSLDLGAVRHRLAVRHPPLSIEKSTPRQSRLTALEVG